jgi:hypothetical protein
MKAHTMKTFDNPFSPNFGQLPRKLLGRGALVDEFIGGLNARVKDPRRTTLFSGIRGSGKTALLARIAQEARNQGWLVVEVTAGEALLQDILETASIEINQGHKKNIKLSSVSVGALGFSAGVGLTVDDEHVSGWRAAITQLCDELAKQKTGLLITIDEVQTPNSRLRQFATTYQHLLINGYELACAMAGLPEALHDTLNTNVLTFLRRSHQVFLGGIEYPLVLDDYHKEADNCGLSSKEGVLEQLARYSSGYPYLIQLLGYLAFEGAREDGKLTTDLVEESFARAQAEMAKAIHQPILSTLSGRDVEYLEAMAVDDGASATAQIAARLEKTPAQLTRYRQRLIDAGVIAAPKRGEVVFVVPLLRDYLRNGKPASLQYGFEDYTTYGLS